MSVSQAGGLWHRGWEEGRGRSWESFWPRAKPHSLAYIRVSCAHSISISITLGEWRTEELQHHRASDHRRASDQTSHSIGWPVSHPASTSGRRRGGGGTQSRLLKKSLEQYFAKIIVTPGTDYIAWIFSSRVRVQWRCPGGLEGLGPSEGLDPTSNRVFLLNFFRSTQFPLGRASTWTDPRSVWAPQETRVTMTPPTPSLVRDL